jgi:nitrogenase subunit NifH
MKMKDNTFINYGNNNNQQRASNIAVVIHKGGTGKTTTCLNSTIPFAKKVFLAELQALPVTHHVPDSTVGKAYKKMAKNILHGNQYILSKEIKIHG